MAGGTWRIQNKVRPGVYINTRGDGKPALVDVPEQAFRMG